MAIGRTNTGSGTGKSEIIVTAPTGSVVYIENQDGKQKTGTGKVSRNLLPYTKLTAKTSNGYTFTPNSFGVHVSGTGNGSTAVTPEIDLDLEPGTYTVCGTRADVYPVLTQVRITQNGSDTYYETGSTFTVDGTEESIKFCVKVTKSTLTLDTMAYPMMVKGSNSVAFEQYYEGSRWTFKNCDVGTWTVHASQNGQKATRTVEITEEGQQMRYYVTIAYFSATITATYPAGSVCTCSKGNIVLKAPNTSGSVVFTVPEAGEWVVSCNNGLSGDEYKKTSYTVTITKDGQTETVTLEYILYLYRDGVFGSNHTTYGSNVTFTEEEKRLGLKTKSSANSSGSYVFGPVKLDGFSSVDASCVRISGTQNYCLHVFVADDPKVLYKNATIKANAKENLDELSTVLDISAVKGDYYVYVGTNTEDSSWVNSRTLGIVEVLLQ